MSIKNNNPKDTDPDKAARREVHVKAAQEERDLFFKGFGEDNVGGYRTASSNATMDHQADLASNSKRRAKRKDITLETLAMLQAQIDALDTEIYHKENELEDLLRANLNPDQLKHLETLSGAEKWTQARQMMQQNLDDELVDPGAFDRVQELTISLEKLSEERQVVAEQYIDAKQEWKQRYQSQGKKVSLDYTEDQAHDFDVDAALQKERNANADLSEVKKEIIALKIEAFSDNEDQHKYNKFLDGLISDLDARTKANILTDSNAPEDLQARILRADFLKIDYAELVSDLNSKSITREEFNEELALLIEDLPENVRNSIRLDEGIPEDIKSQLQKKGQWEGVSVAGKEDTVENGTSLSMQFKSAHSSDTSRLSSEEPAQVASNEGFNIGRPEQPVV